MSGQGDKPGAKKENLAHPGAGQPVHTEDLIAIGKIRKSWGLTGHVKVKSYAESPDTYRRIRDMYIAKANNTIPLMLESIKEHREDLLMKFQGRNRIEEVEDILQETLYMHKRDLAPLEEGEYYWHQLIGMDVQTDSGKHLGTLREIISTGSNDVYVVQNEEQEILIPAIEDVIRKVEVDKNRMTIHPLDGMLDENDL